MGFFRDPKSLILTMGIHDPEVRSEKNPEPHFLITAIFSEIPRFGIFESPRFEIFGCGSNLSMNHYYQ